MKTLLKIVASLLLIFNGAGAILGGWEMMTHPDGSSLQISLDYLRHSPFNDFFFPGIILFTVNGLFSFFVLGTIVFRYKHSATFILAQGATLTGWIIIQMILVRDVHILHIIFGLVGIMLLLCGWVLEYKYRGEG